MIHKYYSFYLVLLLIGCNQPSNFLDDHFRKLEHESPHLLIDKFKRLPFDSAIILNDRFSEIFVKAANTVMSDSAEAKAFREYFKKNNIQLLGRQDKWTIVAAFHKYLNGEKYEIYDLWQEMIKFSNEEYERRYPPPSKN